MTAGAPATCWATSAHGQILLADPAHDSDALRTALAERGAWANLKPLLRCTNVLAFSSFLYRYRSLVEAAARNGARQQVTRLSDALSVFSMQISSNG